MPTDIDTENLYTLAVAVLAAVVDYYDDNAFDDQRLPDRRYVADGIPAFDSDQLTVHCSRAFPMGTANSTGESAATTFREIIRRGAEFVIIIVRCTPTVDGNGNDIEFPEPEALQLSARRVLIDAEMMADAVVTAYRDGDLPGCGNVIWGGWTALEPEGGLAGGMATLRLVLD